MTEQKASKWPTCERKTCGRPQRAFHGRDYQVPICEALQGGSGGRCSRTRWNPEGGTKS